MLGNEAFGIEIRVLIEIISIQPLNPMPDEPEYVKGVLNLRGKVFPVIDMRLKFKMSPMEYTQRTCIIIVNTEKFQRDSLWTASPRCWR
jgi:purine-binding chemotaxis protein CheW